jgi:hypothetical protein
MNDAAERETVEYGTQIRAADEPHCVPPRDDLDAGIIVNLCDDIPERLASGEGV